MSMTGIPNEFLEQFRALIINNVTNSEKSEDKTIKKSNTDEFINKYNDIVLENERQKQRFKKGILILVGVLTSIQLIFFNAVVVFVLMSCITKIKFFKILTVKEISEILNFLKYFIGATVVELLGMLLFIIRYVFSDMGLQKKIPNKKASNKKS